MADLNVVERVVEARDIGFLVVGEARVYRLSIP